MANTPPQESNQQPSAPDANPAIDPDGELGQVEEPGQDRPNPDRNETGQEQKRRQQDDPDGQHNVNP